MATSTQITNKILSSANPRVAEQLIWEKTRYLVAQIPASQDSDVTQQGYYKGRVVIPGPKANPEVSEVLMDTDLQTLKDNYFIRFTDNNTTSSAEESVVRALYTIMSDSEASEYEDVLYKVHGKKRSNDELKTVSS